MLTVRVLSNKVELEDNELKKGTSPPPMVTGIPAEKDLVSVPEAVSIRSTPDLSCDISLITLRICKCSASSVHCGTYLTLIDVIKATTNASRRMADTTVDTASSDL
jgi:hypothetical protein